MEFDTPQNVSILISPSTSKFCHMIQLGTTPSVVWKYFLSIVHGEGPSNTKLGLYDELLSNDQLKNASEIEFRSSNSEYIPGPD